MADNIVTQLYPAPWPVVVTDPAAPNSGDPVRFGVLTGIALNDEGLGGLGATETMVDFGIYIADHPVNDHVGGGIAVGASLFYVDAADRLENDSAGYFYGFALEIVGAGATTTIKVMHVPSPGAGTLGAGTIATANLAAGIISADAPGRALFAAGVFDVATALSVFGANTIANAFLLDAVADGAFAADAATRALFANGFLTGDKLATGVINVTVVAGEDETATHQITCAGMAAGDEVVTVLVLTTAAAIATMAKHAGTLVAAAGKITTDTEVNNTNNQYLIVWVDKTP